MITELLCEIATYCNAYTCEQLSMVNNQYNTIMTYDYIWKSCFMPYNSCTVSGQTYREKCKKVGMILQQLDMHQLGNALIYNVSTLFIAVKGDISVAKLCIMSPYVTLTGNYEELYWSVEKDIQLVINQTKASRALAISALLETRCDIVNAILSINLSKSNQ